MANELLKRQIRADRKRAEQIKRLSYSLREASRREAAGELNVQTSGNVELTALGLMESYFDTSRLGHFYRLTAAGHAELAKALLV
jgi:hypothetical protein